MSQRCDECKPYREATAYVFDREKSYCAKGHDIGYAQLDYSLYDKKCKDYILNISRKWNVMAIVEKTVNVKIVIVKMRNYNGGVIWKYIVI